MFDYLPLRSVTPAIDIYVKLAQFPILSDAIRKRMRQELFRRGIITKEAFEQEVREKAIESQFREGLRDPFFEEDANVWQERKARIRDYQTDSYFANNLGTVLLNQIISEVMESQAKVSTTTALTFNPEIAPWELLFKQGEIYEAMPSEERERVLHHLEEIKVVLIKRMISDQLPFIAIAKRVFQIADLRRIYRRRIGRGKIGGKSAGMALAWKILQEPAPGSVWDASNKVAIPESFFIGSEVIYDFRLMNNLDNLMNQKYRPLDEIRADHPAVIEAHLRGEFPEEIVMRLRQVLEKMGDSPLIVRSSSLLEDNFGFSFAGKYESFFCPNQGTPEENLQDLLDAIRRVYASSLNPDAILYRQRNGLIDYDERMGVLLQEVKGERHGRYFFPTLAGVAFSQNPFRWNEKIRREDGFLRLVTGIGTRAVDRVGRDYPRMLALSHPQLRPETTAKAIRQYSQEFIDVIDLEDNQFKTLPFREVIGPEFPNLRLIASIDKRDYLSDILSVASLGPSDRLVLTFSKLTKEKKFVDLMRTALVRLEEVYEMPVDVEFTVEIIPDYPYPSYKLNLLQCRPLSTRVETGRVTIPDDIPDGDILFTAYKLIPDGQATGIRYIIFVDPDSYYHLSDQTIKLELGRAIGRLNKRLEKESFILIGPGRWGSANLELGVRVTYADIFNTKVLVEMAVAQNGHMPELSYGTHFFQDLVESGIHSLPLHLAEGDGRFNWDFFHHSPNMLAALSPQDVRLSDYITVIDIAAIAVNLRLNILMDGAKEKAVGYLVQGNWAVVDSGEGTLSTF
ncbi:MAG: PEP/pyruvate-binding domain-containing protein [Ardenticatenaceae bacterium]|nr:PEP/pyruvate-binding domain-containing protein [Ardenticatenaceae bacterium]